MITPPPAAIDIAVEAANKSPCQHSKRGVVLFRQTSIDVPLILGSGFNGPPGKLPCHGTDACATACASYCVHAEVRAILDTKVMGPEIQAVHVKTVDGVLMAGGGPSCLPCATLVLDVGITKFWLYEASRTGDDPAWWGYSATQFYKLSGGRVS